MDVAKRRRGHLESIRDCRPLDSRRSHRLDGPREDHSAVWRKQGVRPLRSLGTAARDSGQVAAATVGGVCALALRELARTARLESAAGGSRAAWAPPRARSRYAVAVARGLGGS